MKKFLLVAGVILFIFFANPTQAQYIISCNSTGFEKNIFYDNETVYIKSISNITSANQTVDIYIIYDDYWLYTTLTDVSGGKKTNTTNSEGYLELMKIWSPKLTAGKYDIVVDIDRDGMYNYSIDHVDNLTATGFEVIAVPVPTLSVAVGPNSTLDHDWRQGDPSYNTMLQLKLTAGSAEDVKVSSIALSASGTGNDKNGVRVVYLVLDDNSNGVYEQGEVLLSYGQYIRDDGILMLNIENGYTVYKDQTVYMLIVYTMTNSTSNGETYNFQVASISAAGAASGEQVIPTGFPIASATKTIIATATTTTTTTVATITTTSTSTTTTTLPPTTTTSPFQLPQLGSNWIYIVLAIGLVPVAIVAIILVVLFLRKKTGSRDKFEELKEKWKKY